MNNEKSSFTPKDFASERLCHKDLNEKEECDVPLQTLLF